MGNWRDPSDEDYRLDYSSSAKFGKTKSSWLQPRHVVIVILLGLVLSIANLFFLLDLDHRLTSAINAQQEQLEKLKKDVARLSK